MAQHTTFKSEPTYDVYPDVDIMVSMRDGIRLATDIYLPAINGKAAAGPFPTIMERTLYDKSTHPRQKPLNISPVVDMW